MDFDEFNDINAPIRRRYIPGVTNIFLNSAPRPDASKIAVRERHGTDFSKDAKKKQEAILRSKFEKLSMHGGGQSSGLEGLTDIETTSCDTEFTETRMKDQRALYRRFGFNRQPFNPKLTIHEFRGEILKQIRGSPVLVIQGHTGCGKSTQVPQYILDEAYHDGKFCNVIVTQPRRIAAITLAEQVSRERKCDVGTLVGYQIGLDKKVSEDTRITFCTTGVLLQQIVQSKRMGMYTHIILDEIHERDEDMEFLLIAIKRLLVENPFQTKIILMSATIDTNQFAKYFSLPQNGVMVNAPTLRLTKRSQYSIQTYYMEDLTNVVDRQYNFNIDKPGIDAGLFRVACGIIVSFNVDPQFAKNGICILIFLPGIHEIAEMYRILEEDHVRLKQLSKNANELPDWKLIPLHSTMSSDEQRLAFKPAVANEVKIILATNIAESSITVPDVKFVIDFCMTRTLEIDPDTGFSILRLKYASKNSCDQRAGRTGRTCNGRCFRLTHKEFYMEEMPEQESSALVRCSLEKVVLKAKKIDENVSPAEIIGLALEPPDLTDIHLTILKLKEARGLHFKKDKVYVPDDGDLTFIGRVMEALPLDIRATRLIIMGYMFDVLEDCIIIAAGLTVQKVFTLNFQNTMRTYTQKVTFSDGSGSDLFAILYAYKYMIEKCNPQNGKSLSVDIQNFASRNSLDIKGILEMYQLVDEITKRLVPFKIERNNHPIGLSPKDRNIILKVCIAGAFYPNYFTRTASSSKDEHERLMYHELNGRDPKNTVYYRNIGRDELGMLYVDQVKHYLQSKKVIKSKDDVEVTFDDSSRKMYVTFLEKHSNNNDKYLTAALPGQIKIQVYKSIKLTREREPLILKLLDQKFMYNYAEQVGVGTREGTSFVFKKQDLHAGKICCVPRLYEKQISGLVTHVSTPNKFWVRPLDRNNDIVLRAIENALKLKLKPYPSDKLDDIVGRKVAVKLEDGFYRARVESTFTEDTQTKYRVFLIDDGTEHIVAANRLNSISDIKLNTYLLGLPDGPKVPLAEIPPRVFEASLAETRPSYLASSTGKWTFESINHFKELTLNSILTFDIYSFWNGVVSVVIHDNKEGTINERLVKLQMAESCEESYPSKYDHALRFKIQNFTNNQYHDKTPYQEIEQYLRDFLREPIKSPPEKHCSTRVQLRGPFSPLETTVHPVIRSLYTKVIEIERYSVNSVLLDTDSNDPTERLVVASSCGSDACGSKMHLRNTTIMPNIHGFGALMAMLFSPKLEIHPDKEGTRFNSILCGLGYDRAKKRGYFEEHDLIMNLDCVLDQDDLIQINKIRYTMSAILHTNQGEIIPNLNRSAINDLRRALFRDLFEFLKKPRQLIDVRSHPTYDHQWGLIGNEDILSVPVTDIYGERAMFPGFTFKRLSPQTQKEIEDFRQNNEDLYQIAFGHKPMGLEFTCLLCSKTLTSVPDVQIHLFRKLHIDRTIQYGVEFDLNAIVPESKKKDDDLTSYYSENFYGFK